MENKDEVIYLDVEEVLGGKGIDINMSDPTPVKVSSTNSTKKSDNKFRKLKNSTTESFNYVHGVEIPKIQSIKKGK